MFYGDNIMKYEKMTAEIIIFGEDEFMTISGQWTPNNHCVNKSGYGDWGSYHDCPLVTRTNTSVPILGRHFLCSGHSGGDDFWCHFS